MLEEKLGDIFLVQVLVVNVLLQHFEQDWRVVNNLPYLSFNLLLRQSLFSLLLLWLEVLVYYVFRQLVTRNYSGLTTRSARV